MKQEDREILLKDLCARLPYGVKCCIEFDDGKIFSERTLMPIMIQDFKSYECLVIKPYLRPMSSMTEEEYKELRKVEPYYGLAPFEQIYDWGPNYKVIDWLNSHHFDYRGLIEKGLALEAPERMYKF